MSNLCLTLCIVALAFVIVGCSPKEPASTPIKPPDTGANTPAATAPTAPATPENVPASTPPAPSQPTPDPTATTPTPATTPPAAAPTTPTAPAAAPKPAEDMLVLRIDCGSKADYTDPNGNVWKADRDFTKDGWGRVGGDAVTRTTVDKIENTDSQPLYLTELFGMDAYRITCPNGTYSVTLCFAETYHEAPDIRSFDVSIEGKKVLTAFDPVRVAGKPYIAITRTFETQVTDGELTIDFIRDIEQPEINAIQVIQTK